MNHFAFDDRLHPYAGIDVLSEKLVREFLEDTSHPAARTADWKEALRHLDVLREVDGQTMVVNLGVLFFCEEPEKFIRGARIEITHFDDRDGTQVVDEKVISGPLHVMLEDASRYLSEQAAAHPQEPASPETAAAEPRSTHPDAAVEELLVNALCHRGWGEGAEGVKVFVFPDRYEVVSYPGPHATLRPDHFGPGRRVPPIPHRNRRIVEFMKLLGFADGAYCGLPMIYRMTRETGAPHPQVDFDESRSYFRAILPTKFDRVSFGYRRDSDAFRYGRHNKRYGFRPSFERSGYTPLPAGAPLSGYPPAGIPGLSGSATVPPPIERPVLPPIPLEDVTQALANAEFMIDDGRIREAVAILDRMPETMPEPDTVRAAILERRVRRHDRAHRLFENAMNLVQSDPRTLHEFAQTKINLAQEIWRERGLGRDVDDNQRIKLLEESRDLLIRVVRMDAPPTRHAWAYFNLGQVLYRLRAPRNDVLQAYETAVRLAPREDRFREALEKHRHFDSAPY